MALAVIVTACTGDDDVSPTTILPTTAAPAPSTTATPSTTTSTTSTTTSTTIPQGLGPQVLGSGYEPGTLAEYSAVLETRLAWSGESAGVLFDAENASSGSLTTELAGRRLLLAVAARDGVEVVEDFRVEGGTVVSELDGELVETDLAREDLGEFKAATPPLLLDSSLRVIGGLVSGAPAGLVAPFDPLATAALVGPPLGDGPVDVGDSWIYSRHDDILGSVSIEASIVEEIELEDDSYAFAIEFSGTAVDAPVTVDLGAAPGITGAIGDAGLPGFLPVGVSTTVTVRSAALEGSAVFDPVRGIPIELESLLALSLEFGTENAGEGDAPAFTIDSTTFRSGVLDSFSGQASAFAVEGVLDRFEVDPFTLSAEAVLDVPGYDIVDATDAEAQQVFDILSDVRQDLFPGATIGRLVDGSGDEVVIVSLTTGGDLRGAPFVAEEVVGFLAGVSPRRVSIGERTAFRATVGSQDWLVYNNETHLFVAIGEDDDAERALDAVVSSTSPYLWQSGDCFDFTDGFFDDAPYAPFGLHGARHCSLGHVYEVIYSEVLPEGPDAAFPDDIAVRSNQTCGRAFNTFTGTTELESALALIRYLPDREEWEKGARYLACVVYRTGPDGELTVSGRIDGSDPDLALSLETGTCLFDLFPVGCDEPHNEEVIAVLELDGGPEAPLPAAGDIDRTVAAGCDAALAELEVGAGPGVVVARGLSDAPLTWEFGTRRYYCLAAALDPGGFILDVTGTFADGWEEAQERVTA